MTHVTSKPLLKQEYLSIQVLRAVAAASVVLFHLQTFEGKYLPGDPIAPKLFAIGEIGVDLFFVISGFIITTSTRGIFQQRKKSILFLFRRFARIYPIYWVYCIVLLIGYLIHPGIFSGVRGKPDILASFMLVPGNGALLLLISWSLTFEIQFYIVFAVAIMFLPERRLMVAAGIWAVLIIARNLFVTGSLGPFDLPLDLFNLEFLTGCFLARVAGGVPRPVGLLSLVLGVVILVGGWIIFVQSDGKIQQGWPRILVGGGGFALLLLAAVVWEEQLRRVVPWVTVALGNSSYSLYLSHLLTSALVGYAWKEGWPRPDAVTHVLALGSAFVIALVVGWLSFCWLEQPLLKLSRLIIQSLRRSNSRVVEVAR